MRLSREKLIAAAEATSFRPEVLEKVFHLLALLNAFRSHPFLNGRLALKGGTALNLFEFDVPRLSVDIDLNFVGATQREEMMALRPKVHQAVAAVCSREGLAILRLPEDHAGGKCLLRFEGNFSRTQTLEVDLNFMFRQPLWPIRTLDSHAIGEYRATGISVMDLHELAAGKLAALMARRTSRDLFDASQLFDHEDLDLTKLRLAFIVYGAMNRRDWRNIRIDDVDLDAKELTQNLMPMVRSGFIEDVGNPIKWAKGLIARCRKSLAGLLAFTAGEKEFLDRILDHGEIRPSLLTSDNELAQKIGTHPLLLWKAQNVREHKRRA